MRLRIHYTKPKGAPGHAWASASSGAGWLPHDLQTQPSSFHLSSHPGPRPRSNRDATACIQNTGAFSQESLHSTVNPKPGTRTLPPATPPHSRPGPLRFSASAEATHLPFTFQIRSPPFSTLLCAPGGRLDGYPSGAPNPRAPVRSSCWGAEAGGGRAGESEMGVLLPSASSPRVHRRKA